MSSRIKRIYRFFLDVERHELLKVMLLTLAFFLVVGAYTVTRELKDAVFSTIVGQDRKLLAYAKIFSMLVLIPAIFLHSRLVDLVRRHSLLYFYAVLYAVLGFLFVFFLGHPTIGLANAISSPYRIFGWLFYFFIEGYPPLVVGVFWAFTNSITAPSAVKNNYPVMIAGSKLGGIVAASSAWLVLRNSSFGDVLNLQVLLAGCSVMLAVVPFVIYYLMKKVPHRELHGYEAGYKLEKVRHKQEEEASVIESMLSGLTMFFKYPYVMGIFGMGFFYEMIIQALKVENIIFGKNASSTLSEFTSFLLWQALLVHVVAFCVVTFGTRALISALGERRSLLLIPATTALSMIGFVIAPSYATAIFAFVVTRSVNYAFAAPLRESLYIPTVKEVQFKSKSWIEGVGNKFAKTCASSFNMYTDGMVGQMLLTVQTTFFGIVLFFWFITVYLLGWRFEKAIKRNEVIGAEAVADVPVA